MEAEVHRISCPYEPLGYADIVVERPGGSLEVKDFDEPRMCVTCGRWFNLRYRVQILGVPLNAATQNGKVKT